MEVARWETRGHDWLSLRRNGASYSYVGNGCGGTLPFMPDDNAAVEWMERPWGKGGAGPVTVLRDDRPSLKRVG